MGCLGAAIFVPSAIVLTGFVIGSTDGFFTQCFFVMLGLVPLIGLIIFMEVLVEEGESIRTAPKRLARVKSELAVRQLAPDEAAALRELVLLHRATLLSRRARLVRDDGYGNEDRSRWEAHLWYFHDNVIKPDGRLTRWLDAWGTWSEPFENYEFELPPSEIPPPPAQALERLLDGDNRSVGDVNYRDPTGATFEHACAATLEAAGWDCLVVGTSGDQGVDVVARRGQMAVAIQCKDWSRPVGNSAVQEVYAGMVVYDCTTGVVVAGNGFTKSAVELADKTGVLLVSPGQLDGLATLIGIG